MPSRSIYFSHNPGLGIKFIKIPAAISIKPCSAINGVKMIFMYSFNTGISKPMYFCACFMRFINKPGETFFKYIPGYFLNCYPTECDIWVILCHSQEVILPPVPMPNGDRLLPSEPFQLNPQSFHLLEPYDTIYIQFKEKVYFVSVYPLRIFFRVSIPIGGAVPLYKGEGPTIQEEATQARKEFWDNIILSAIEITFKN